ncbi:MAG TPA: hypothetical protein VKB57_06095 [Acidimicrobiales bacterium]|nr:hypothetical protein [Acidimicrobiales bacterium]
MPDDLDEVASRLAEVTLKVRAIGQNPLVAAGERRDDFLGQAMGVLGVVVSVPSTLLGLFRTPDPMDTRRLYQRATGVGRDRANADVNVVIDRLGPLAATTDDQGGDELVRSAARRLVAWVAAGQPDDDDMAGVEAAFARWADVLDARDHSEVELGELTDRCIEAWAVTCGPDAPTR